MILITDNQVTFIYSYITVHFHANYSVMRYNSSIVNKDKYRSS